MASPLRELFALFDVDTGSAETKLRKLSGVTDLAKEGLAQLALTAISGFSAHAIVGFVEDMVHLGSELNDMSEKLGVSTDELQKFQYAAKMTGVDGEEAAKALGFLNRNIGEAIGGSQEVSKQFAEMGVQLKDNHGDVRELGDVLPEVADAFQKMGSQQERTAAAMKLFGRSGASLLPLLKDGSAGLQEMNERFEELGLGINEDFIHKADDAGDAINTLKLGFRALKTRIAVEVLPGITDLAKKFSGWVVWAQKVTRETNIVKEAWIGIAVIAALAGAKVIAGWSKVLGLFPKEGSLITKLFSMGEVALIVAALVLLGLAIEDIVVMCQGGESVIGDFLDQFLGIEKKQELVDSLNNAWQQMQPSLEALGPLIADIGGAFAAALPYAIALVVDLLRVVLAAGLAIQTLVHAIEGMADGKSTWSKIGDRFMKDSDAIFGSKGVLSNSTLLDTISAPSVQATAVGGGGDRKAIGYERGDTSISVTVNGGPSNEDTGRTVGRAVKDAQEQAERRAAAHAAFRGTSDDIGDE